MLDEHENEFKILVSFDEVSEIVALSSDFNNFYKKNETFIVTMCVASLSHLSPNAPT